MGLALCITNGMKCLALVLFGGEVGRGLLLDDMHLREEGAEQADADAEADDEPEEDVFRVDAGEPVDECAEAEAE